MKISTLIWLKAAQSRSGPTLYSSRVYALELEDGFDVAHTAAAIEKIRQASYGEAGALDALGAPISVTGIIKQMSQRTVITEALDGAFDVIGITKHKNPAAEIAAEAMAAGMAVASITKKYGAGYVVYQLEVEALDASTVVAELTKARRVKLGAADDGFDAASAVAAIAKVSRAHRGEAVDDFDASLAVTTIAKVRQVARKRGLKLYTGYTPPTDGRIKLNLESE